MEREREEEREEERDREREIDREIDREREREKEREKCTMEEAATTWHGRFRICQGPYNRNPRHGW